MVKLRIAVAVIELLDQLHGTAKIINLVALITQEALRGQGSAQLPLVERRSIIPELAILFSQIWSSQDYLSGPSRYRQRQLPLHRHSSTTFQCGTTADPPGALASP
jgi:hypothetical protein